MIVEGTYDLAEVVRNPAYDGRCRYGLEAVRSFAAGVQVVVLPGDRWRVVGPVRGSALRVDDFEVKEALAPHLRPSAPTAASVVATFDAEWWSLGWFLCWAVEVGELDVGRVAELLSRFDARPVED